MKPNNEFRSKGKVFWACVRTLSQEVGYSEKGRIIVPTLSDISSAFGRLDLDPALLLEGNGPSALALDLMSYLKFRSEILHDVAKSNLMTAEQAEKLFKSTVAKYNKAGPFVMNKQKKEKRAPAYLTNIVNIIIEAEAKGFPCVYDPRQLTTITKDRRPVRTLARRVDGAFPEIVNPIAIWEIKEYYYTTTFGSRIADGIYETLLDGLELEELRAEEGIDVKHYLVVDSYETWWDMGKPYLCRMVDMLHMGYVDEILFGKEVVSELPRIVGEWVKTAEKLGKRADLEAELK